MPHFHVICGPPLVQNSYIQGEPVWEKTFPFLSLSQIFCQNRQKSHKNGHYFSCK